MNWLDRIIPGKKGDKCFMWAPQVGHGDHFGILFGGSFSKDIWHNEDGDQANLTEDRSQQCTIC